MNVSGAASIAYPSRRRVLPSQMLKHTCSFKILRLTFTIGSHLIITSYYLARAGAEVSKIGHGYRKSMAYKIVFEMQKPWAVEVARRINEWRNLVEMPMKWCERIPSQLNERINVPMNRWTNKAMTQGIHEWTNEAAKQWLNESTNQWANKSVNQWIDDSVNQ